MLLRVAVPTSYNVSIMQYTTDIVTLSLCVKCML